MSVNKVILIGNLGADPEVRNTNSGVAVANLRLASTERVKNRETDAYEDHTEWHRCVAFGKTAENLGKYCRKGKQLYIEGRLRTRKWTDSAGVEKYSTEIIADVVQFLGGKSEDTGGGGYGGKSSGQRGSHGQDADVPF